MENLLLILTYSIITRFKVAHNFNLISSFLIFIPHFPKHKHQETRRPYDQIHLAYRDKTNKYLFVLGPYPLREQKELGDKSSLTDRIKGQKVATCPYCESK